MPRIPNYKWEATMDYSCIENPLVRDPGKKITFTGEVELRESDEIKDLYEMLLQQPVGHY